MIGACCGIMAITRHMFRPLRRYPVHDLSYRDEYSNTLKKLKQAIQLLKRTQDSLYAMTFDSDIDEDIQAFLWDNFPRATFYIHRQMPDGNYAFMEDTPNLTFRNEDDLLASDWFGIYSDRAGFVNFWVEHRPLNEGRQVYTVYAKYTDIGDYMVGWSNTPITIHEQSLVR